MRASSTWRQGSRFLIGTVLLSWVWGAWAQDSSSRVEENLATFDAAWEIIHSTHFDSEFNGVDWQAVRSELRPKAREAETDSDLRRILGDMVGRLAQSHFNVIPRRGAARDGRGDASGTPDPACRGALATRVLEAASSEELSPPELGRTGLVIRLMDEEVVVVRVEARSPAHLAGVKPGWRITRVESEEMEQLLGCAREALGGSSDSVAWSVVLSLLAGEVGSEIGLEFEADEERRVVLTLRRAEPAGEISKFGNLPPMPTQVTYGWLEQPEVAARIGVVRFNIWLIPVRPQLQIAMEELATAEGLILDLRGNPGGIAALAQGIAGHFIDERLSLGTLKTRKEELELRINPQLVSRSGQRIEPYAGPVAILIDSFSGSTTELFAAGLQDHGRARLFGEPSAAAALPAVMDRLPNGDVLMHAIADLIRPNGMPIEGNPVVPDEIVHGSRESLLAGRDEPLLAAVRWIAEQGVDR